MMKTVDLYIKLFFGSVGWRHHILFTVSLIL